MRRRHDAAREDEQSRRRPLGEPGELVRRDRLARALQVAGRDLDPLQPLLDGKLARRQLEHHPADLVSELAVRLVAADADRAEHAHGGGHLLAPRLEPAMERFGDDGEDRVVDRAAVAVFQCLEGRQ